MLLQDARRRGTPVEVVYERDAPTNPTLLVVNIYPSEIIPLDLRAAIRHNDFGLFRSQIADECSS